VNATSGDLLANYLSTTVSQSSGAAPSLGLVTAGETRGVRKERPPLEAIQRGDGGGDVAFRPHRERPAA
jgi:hypothetical protein